MQDLSLHILDIVENSIAAGAEKIEITINENIKKNMLSIMIRDNGKGMDKKTLNKALDPFYTTKKTRRVGLGLSMLAQAAKEAEGNFDIKSKRGCGTTVTAAFEYDHIDRKPIGDMAKTMIALIVSHALHVDFIYVHKKDGKELMFDTRQIKKELNGIPINDVEVLKFLEENIRKELENMGAKI